MDVHEFDFDTNVKTACARILRLGGENPTISGPSFARRLADAVEQGLHRLDQTPRTDPFWIGTNGLPTLTKLSDFAAFHAGDVDLALADLAIGLANGGHEIASSAFWALDRAFPIEWLAEAGWLSFWHSGQRISMMATAERIGRRAEYEQLLERLTQATDDPLRQWARTELAC